MKEQHSNLPALNCSVLVKRPKKSGTTEPALPVEEILMLWQKSIAFKLKKEKFMYIPRTQYCHNLQEPTSGDNFNVSRVSILYIFLCSFVLYLNCLFHDFREIIWPVFFYLHPSFGGRLVASSHLRAGVLPFYFASHCSFNSHLGFGFN